MQVAKPSKKQLDESNVMVKLDKSARSRRRIAPVKALPDPIERFLPPAGQYYDQSTLKSFADMLDRKKRCVLCWNPKRADEKCNCMTACAVCDTKQHRNHECPMIYADIQWWRAHGHRLRKKAQRRPNPGEWAYLVVAGVLKDWKRLRGPVVVNLENPGIAAFYEGKAAPQRLFVVPPRLSSTPAATETKLRTDINANATTIPVVFEPGFEEEKACFGGRNIRDTALHTTTVQPGVAIDSIKALVGACKADEKAGKISRQEQAGSLSTEEEDEGLFNLLEDTWQPPSYHNSGQYATMTPLSIRLAVISAQQLADAKLPIVSNGNEVRAPLDPRVNGRMRAQHNVYPLQPLTGICVGPGNAFDDKDIVKAEMSGQRTYEQELEQAREEIRARDRRIQELELALHEAEGWTDAITYRVGQKRLRE